MALAPAIGAQHRSAAPRAHRTALEKAQQVVGQRVGAGIPTRWLRIGGTRDDRFEIPRADPHRLSTGADTLPQIDEAAGPERWLEVQQLV